MCRQIEPGFSIYGVCWVPNIGGKVTSRNHLETNITDSAVSVFGVSLHIMFDGKVVKVSEPGGRMHIVIEPIDESGLCLIHANAEVYPMSDDSPNDPILSYRIDALWIGFRHLIDGCSEICQCTAMDHVIPYCDDSPHDDLAGRFITTLENITDANTYARARDTSDRSVHEQVLLNETLMRTNILYFQRFVDIYADRLKDCEDYRSQISCRKDKGEIVSHYNSESRSIGQATEIMELVDASNGLAEANNALVESLRTYASESRDIDEAIRRATESSEAAIGSVKRYTENISRLSEEMKESTEKSDHKARVSIYIAAVTAVMTFCALVATYVQMLG